MKLLMYLQIIEVLGWYPAKSVLPHGEKMSLKPWLAIVLVMVSQKNTLLGKCFYYIDQPQTPSLYQLRLA